MNERDRQSQDRGEIYRLGSTKVKSVSDYINFFIIRRRTSFGKLSSGP